jgi:hypothetical protein
LDNVEDRPGPAAFTGPDNFEIHALDCFVFQDHPAQLLRIDDEHRPV